MSANRANALPEGWQRLITEGVEAARSQTTTVVNTLARELPPAVASARRVLEPQVASALKVVGPQAGVARKAVQPYVWLATDQFAPILSRVAPAAEQAWRAAEPQLATARRELLTSVLPTVTKAVSEAYVASRPVREEALRRAEAAVDALRGDTAAGRRGGAGGRWPLAVGFLAAGAAVGAAVDRFVRPGGAETPEGR